MLQTSMMVKLAGILLLLFSPWGEIHLKEFLWVPSCSELEDEVMEVKSFPSFFTGPSSVFAICRVSAAVSL